MTVHDAIFAAEALLPGHAAPEGEIDQRWQAIIAVGEFVVSEPDAIWSFIARWGCSPDEDLRAAVATCPLEHLLEHHFDRFIARMEQAALGNRYFADTIRTCWEFGQSEEPKRAARFDRLIESVRKQIR